MNPTRFALILTIVTVVVACKNEPPAPTVNSNTIQASPVTIASSLPVKEDFEEQAQSAITSANLDDQLDALEKQIGK